MDCRPPATSARPCTDLISSRARASSKPGTPRPSSPFAGNHRDKGTLAQAPAHAGEIEQARSALEDDGVDAVLGHQPPRLLETRHSLVVRDRHDAVGHRPKRADRRRTFAVCSGSPLPPGRSVAPWARALRAAERRPADTIPAAATIARNVRRSRVHHRPRLTVAFPVWWAAAPTGRASRAAARDR